MYALSEAFPTVVGGLICSECSTVHLWLELKSLVQIQVQRERLRRR